ncbi:MAG: helix-turn-helix transcriptional regulator [Pseudomonadota bacterium]
MTNVPEEIDRHVGARLRFMRKVNGLSQENLANSVGLTFQQIQKYEQGNNRISASKLWQFCNILGVAPNDFFDGLDNEASVSTEIANGKVAETAMQLHKLENPEVKRRVLELIRHIGRGDASNSEHAA